MTRSPDTNEPGAEQTVLVADDDNAVLALVRRILVQQGYGVTTAGGGEEALAALARGDRRFDLLITDVFMPRLNGPELAKEARRADPELKVLFMSGSLAADLPEFESIRKEHLIAKPFSRRELLREVRSLLPEPDASSD